jgi:hypothetical protein
LLGKELLRLDPAFPQGKFPPTEYEYDYIPFFLSLPEYSNSETLATVVKRHGNTFNVQFDQS